MTEQSTWHINPISSMKLSWGGERAGRLHKCRTCGILLLTGERPGFCCGPGGSKYHEVPPLPPLPPQYNVFLNHRDISHNSRILNLIFSFAALETSHAFPNIDGPPGFLAIQGRVYHRVRPNHTNSAVRWLLYDGFMQNIPYPAWASLLPSTWIDAMRLALQNTNPFVNALQHYSVISRNYPNAELILQDSGAAEVAAIMSYDNTTRSQIKTRCLIISRQSGTNQAISTVSRLWEPLAYPLLFPHGTLGWGLSGNHQHVPHSIDDNNTENDAVTTQMWHYQARLLREERFQIFGHLTNEYIVNMFSRDLECRLNYIRTNQLRLRRNDAALMDVPDIEPNENIYLPASFLGSRRWASNQIADSLAIAAAKGNPTFFITMTCNSNWPEIQSQLCPGQDFTDIPAAVVRVFKRKLTLLLQTLKTMFPHAGRLLYCIHSVEFQKRGLPHAHILVKYPNDCIHPNDIDSVVSAEVPYDANDALLVNTFMRHNHPSPNRPASKYCQYELPDGSRTCRFRYPHPLQPETTFDPDSRIHYRRRNPGDEMIVPHCLPLLRKFQCHINFEVANTSHIFQYLFKYIHKGMLFVHILLLHH